MRRFTSVHDVADVSALVARALAAKADPWAHETLGRRKTLGMLFLNPSLRTRLLQEHRILVGSAGQKQSFRLLPSLALAQEDADRFTEVLAKELSLVHA